MRRTLHIIVIATAVAVPSTGLISLGRVALAQSRQETIAAAKLNLTMEQRYTIREIVRDLKIEKDRGAVQVEVGKIVPKSIHLQRMPAEITAKVSPVKSHLFFLKGDKIVIVDPKDNRVVEVID